MSRRIVAILRRSTPLILLSKSDEAIISQQELQKANFSLPDAHHTHGTRGLSIEYTQPLSRSAIKYSVQRRRLHLVSSVGADLFSAESSNDSLLPLRREAVAKHQSPERRDTSESIEGA